MKVLPITVAISSTALITSILASIPVRASTSSYRSTCISPTITEGDFVYSSPTLTRAKNLARQTAEKLNGGLSNYRSEASMYSPSFEAPCVDNGNNTWTFTFTGSKPGETTPYVKSIITVAKDGSKVTVDYNAAISPTN